MQLTDVAFFLKRAIAASGRNRTLSRTLSTTFGTKFATKLARKTDFHGLSMSCDGVFLAGTYAWRSGEICKRRTRRANHRNV
jgi:hypothetical protein